MVRIDYIRQLIKNGAGKYLKKGSFGTTSLKNN